MNPKFFKTMRQKRKREPDPNAPPRPNLMTHDVKLRKQDELLALSIEQIQHLKFTVRELENKLTNQTNYLRSLHSKLQR